MVASRNVSIHQRENMELVHNSAECAPLKRPDAPRVLGRNIELGDWAQRAGANCPKFHPAHVRVTGRAGVTNSETDSRIWVREVRLTPRERIVLQLICGGYTNKRVAQNLGITPETVKSHAKSIFVKLGARSRIEAVVRALTLGLV